MQPTMNGPIAQFAALGVIALIALFPSPQSLKDTVSPPREEPRVLAPVPTPEALRVALPAAPDVVVFSPFPFYCLPERGELPLSSLNDCVFELSSFVLNHDMQVELASQQLTGTSSHSPYPNPEVEEARRAVAVICRGKWSAGQLQGSPVEAVCSAFQ